MKRVLYASLFMLVVLSCEYGFADTNQAVTETLNTLVKQIENAPVSDTAKIENDFLAAVSKLNSSQEKVAALVQAFSPVSEKGKTLLLAVLCKIRGEEALEAIAPYLLNEKLNKIAAKAVVDVVCPQDSNSFGLRSNQAYDSLEKSIALLDDQELISKAKKHLPAPLGSPDADGFVSLFNGKDMSGWIWNNSWKGRDGGYSVKAGVMVCDPSKGGNIFTDREYSDFIFRFEFKLFKATNNGVGLRAPLDGDAAYTGMEIQILDHDDPEYSWIKPYQAHGSVYGTLPSERGFLKKNGEWNQQEIKVDGRYITVTLNDHVITKGHFDQARAEGTLDHQKHPGLARPSGHIGFLGHGYNIEFKNLSVKELNKEPKKDNVPPEGFTALFNGKDLSGWKGLVADPVQRAKMTPEQLAEAQKKADDSMRQHWNPVDGVLVFDGKGESLCTAKDYGDFEMLVDWKIKDKGDSGIYLRGSPQVQIWDLKNDSAYVGSGGLYNNQKNPAIPLCVADKPVGEWNTFRIIMVGDKVTVYLNNKLVVDNTVLENYWEREKPIYPTGALELQNHGNTLYFKNIYVRELTK